MSKEVVFELDGEQVRVTNPDKIFFPTLGKTKLDVVNYYLSVADGALIGVRDRPMNLKRFPNGAEGDPFFQKRAPTPRPAWIQTATVKFPSDRTADEVVCNDRRSLVWVVNLGCIDLNPWPVRSADVDHPDELRVDLDPQPERPRWWRVQSSKSMVWQASRRRLGRAGSILTCRSSRAGRSWTFAAPR
jgi:DNA primase